MNIAISVPPMPEASTAPTLPLNSGRSRSSQVRGTLSIRSVFTTIAGTPVKVATQPPFSPLRPLGRDAAEGGIWSGTTLY